MISFLEGTLAESWPTRAVINCQGIGYELLIPVTTFDHLPLLGEKVRLLTHLVVREDAHTLYGFFTSGERDLFRLLLHHVSGVGPKTALSILAGTTPQAVRDAVAFYLAAMPDNALTEVLGIQAEVQEKLARGGLELLTRELPDAWIDAMAIAGTPADCTAKLQAFLAAGSAAIGLWLFPLDRGEEVLERTARDVLPRL